VSESTKSATQGKESVVAAVANADTEGQKEIVKIQLLKLKSVVVRAVSEHYSKQTQHE
jgi:hypothetical protein